MNRVFNEYNVSGVWLQIDTYNTNDNCIIIEFEVPKWWLKTQVKELYNTVENFLNEYTSDESQIIYEQANIEKMVLCEVETK